MLLNQINHAFLRTEKTRILFRGSVASLILRACGLGFRIVVAIFLSRLLGAKGYGVYAYAITWLAFLSIPTALGLDHVLLRYVAAYKETGSWPVLKGLLRYASSLGLAAAVVVSLLCIAIIAMFPSIERDLRATMWITIALLPAVVAAQLRQAALRGLDHPGLAQIPESVVYPGLLLAFVAAAHSLTGSTVDVIQIAFSNAAAWIGTLIIGSLLLLSKLPEPVRISRPAYEKSQWMVMVPPLIIIGGMYYMLGHADVLVLGALAPSRQVGVYVVASRGAELMAFMYDAITFAGASLFSSIYVTGDREELQRFTSLSAKTIFWTSLPIYIVFIVVAPWFLALFGEEFVEGAGVFRLLVTAFFASSLGGFVHVMLYMTGHQREVALVMGITAAVNLGLSLLLIPSFGIMGAAIASGTSLLLFKSILVLVLYKHVGIVSFPYLLLKEK